MATPKLGTLLDRLYRKKLEIDAAEEKVRVLKAQRSEIEHAVFAGFRKEELEQSAGKISQASLSRVVNPTVKDWDSVERFVYRNKALDLLQRRIAKGNWTDRLAARNGKPIPGVETYEQVKLNLRKR